MPPRPRRDALLFRPDSRGLLPSPGSPRTPGPSLAFRVQRPVDLVNLQVTAYGLELISGEDGPVLVPGENGGRLKVRFPFQHLGEQACYEDGDPGGGGTEQPGSPPVLARAAYGSRLMISVPRRRAHRLQRAGRTSGHVTAGARGRAACPAEAAAAVTTRRPRHCLAGWRSRCRCTGSS